MRFSFAAVCMACALPLALFLVSRTARADWTVLPESRHQLYQSYSFFIEQHNMGVYRGGSQYWAAVAANFPIAGNNDSPMHPQFVFHFSGNDSMHVNEGGGVFTETLDTRIGFFFELAPPIWDLRFSLGYFHESGHVADGTDDPSLEPLNLGDNVFRIRLLKDWERTFRFGLTLLPIVHAIPEGLDSGANEFAEYFPLGSDEDGHSPKPYLAAGLGNRIFFNGFSSFHAQLGMATGSHFQDKHSHDARLAIGYYDGPDPRAKYAQFKGFRSHFFYVGILFNL
jgi:hypothetical protein